MEWKEAFLEVCASGVCAMTDMGSWTASRSRCSAKQKHRNCQLPNETHISYPIFHSISIGDDENTCLSML